jgi:hypothetical protein
LKSLIYLMKELLDESGSWCHTSTSADLKTIDARFEHEGVSFLTITLPNFGKDFEKSLDQGFVADDSFLGFKRQAGLPRFLSGFLQLVFDSVTGRLLSHPSYDAIRSVRQITLMYSKVALECSDTRIKAAITKYVECEQDVKRFDSLWSSDSKESFGRIGSMLWGNVFSEVDRKVYYGEIIPRHSSGATADRLKGNFKYYQSEWTSRLEEVFPYQEFLTSSYSLALSELENVNILEPGQERPVRVITVPKTLKTPRIIAVEPTAMQYVQQGLLESLVEAISADNLAYDFIGWDSQEPNQRLASLGSASGSLATLDLSEASDRVSNQHVRYLLRNHPHFARAVDACRSRKADVPGHGVIRLAKFASMGSALCFPFEAITFLTVIFMGIERALSRRLSRNDIKSFVGQVRVYGDDIIVPVEYVDFVIDELQTFGFVVNVNKSFWTGKFRESCGKEYFDGQDVSIVKVRQLIPTSRKHVPEIVSTVALRNHLYKSGYWNTVRHLDGIIMGIIPFPYVAETSSALGRFSFLGYDQERMDPHLQRPMVKAAVAVPRLPDSRLDGYGALMKYFLKRGDLPIADREHLERAGRPVSVDIKHRWSHSY